MPTSLDPRVLAILQAAWRRKQLTQPAYSLRALARDVGVSAAFLSNVLSGKKAPPRERLQTLCHYLELDVLEREALVKARLLDSFGAKVLTRARKAKRETARKTSEAPAGTVLANPMNLAVLEGLTLSAPHDDPAALATRLGLTSAQMRRILEGLAATWLIEQVDGRWRKKEQQLYVAGGRSRAEVRAFHDAMIARAREELRKPDAADYERRLINGATLALNPAHLEALKARIIGFLDEVSVEAGEGDCTEVYQLNVQLFPLTQTVRG